MMTVASIMDDLRAHGEEKIKTLLLKHGVREPFFGVKIEHLKTIQKKVKMDYQLAKNLYATGNADAQYLAGLIADDAKMTKADLETWVQQALSQNISEYTVPWVAAGGKYGYELAMEWIESPEERIAAAGWATLGNLAAFKPDAELDIPAYRALLQRVVNTIHTQPNRVKQTMNGFVIAVGAYITPLTAEAYLASAQMGPVEVDMGDTACKVPDAATYIKKIEDRGSLGKKKKVLKC